MNKNVRTRLIAMLLCIVTFIGMLPLTVFADYEDGMECWHCGHYHYDDWCCGQCGACSIEDDNAECFVATHCNECGACFQETVFCLDCMACEDCYVNNGWHCLGCGECRVDEQDDLCGYCWFCADCMGGLCDGCGFCEGCWELELMHCDECGNCYGTYDICPYDYLHCEECCVICEQCDECLYEDGIELCEDCGLCVYCCLDNANAEGCECGEYCIENPDWYEHLCPDCGNAFCAIDRCDTCELCLDCCEGNSECGEMPPLCVEDLEYDEHFCEDCGDCFHGTNLCERCEEHDRFLCESCCEARLEAEGCDCSDRCISDSDIDAHIENVHKNAGPHTASPQKTWEMNENYHWRACRFCGETSHITGKMAHTFDNYGVCTVCRFDSQQVILILKQPKSIVAKVSDIQAADEDDPLHPFNNKRSFTVAAKGTTALKYQWYVSYGGDNKWLAIKEDASPTSYTYASGTKTNTLTVSVPVDGCAYNYAYKCVITDEKGNQVTTNTADMKITHVYRIYQKAKGELIGIINQPNSKDNIGMYASDGHYMVCVGEECDDAKLVPHSFGKETRLVFDSKTRVGWHERTCIHCGYKSYLENHVHYFYDSQTYECEVDFTYKNENQHRLICLFPGCKQTHLESHDYLGWQNHGTPYSNVNGVGVAYKECQICGYSSEKKLQTYDETQDEMVNTQWTKENDLVYVVHGYSSCDVVVNGTKIVIGFAPSEYARMESFDVQYPKVRKWVVTYTCDRGSSGSKVEMDVTKYFEFFKVGDELKWVVTIPLFPGRQGGGILTFTPELQACKHSGPTRIKNASEPICTQDGYTGDTVCADCDGVISYGKVIESAGKHEGKLTLIPGTSKTGSCEEKGYEGTYRCDHCNKTVRGKTTTKVHNAKTVTKNAVKATCTKFGYSGDIYCECGVLLKEGEVLVPRHSNLKLINAVKASCQKKGYTGDWYCYDCNQTVKYGYNVTKDTHAWSKWGKVDDVYHRHTCVVAGCGAAETSKHTDANRDLTCDGCGYAWGSEFEYIIRNIAFNIDIPKIGSKPDYTKFSSIYYYSDGTGTYKKNGVQWYDVTDSKRFVPGGVDQEFKEGHVYKVTIDFRTTEDFVFTDQNDMMATINGKESVVEYVEYEQFAGISYTFPVLAHEHELERVNKVSPTCTASGKNTYYHCTSCNQYYEDAAAKKQISDIAKWGIVSALGHKPGELKGNSTHHFKVCTRCYAEIDGSKAAHTGGTATCVTKAKCTECGLFYGNFAEHNLATDAWVFLTPTSHGRACMTENCQHVGGIAPHRSGGPATVDQDEVCLDCGYVITRAQNHTHTQMGDVQYDDTHHWKVCGCFEIFDKEEHKDSDKDGKCDGCAYTMGMAENNDHCSLLWLWILLVVIVVAGGGFAIYWFVIRKKKKEK